MNKQYDLLGVGIAAVDDLIYVADYPPIDCKIPVHGSTRQGGGPACTAMAAAGSLGGRAAYVARFGANQLSQYIESSLQRHGVDISHIVRDESGGPYHSVIVVDREGHRNVFYDPALYRVVDPKDLPDALIQSTRLVLLDHITEPALIAVAEKVRMLGVPILADIEGRTESAEHLIALSDYLVVPAAFASWASGESEPRAVCALLAQKQRSATVVTNGVGGCYWSAGPEPAVHYFPAFKVDAFDTNGCGDTFHGAFGLAIARKLPVADAIVFASAASALKAMAGDGRRRGWDALPALEEAIAFIRAMAAEPERSSLLDRIDALRNPASSVP